MTAPDGVWLRFRSLQLLAWLTAERLLSEAQLHCMQLEITRMESNSAAQSKSRRLLGILRNHFHVLMERFKHDSCWMFARPPPAFSIFPCFCLVLSNLQICNKRKSVTDRSHDALTAAQPVCVLLHAVRKSHPALLLMMHPDLLQSFKRVSEA